MKASSKISNANNTKESFQMDSSTKKEEEHEHINFDEYCQCILRDQSMQAQSYMPVPIIFMPYDPNFSFVAQRALIIPQTFLMAPPGMIAPIQSSDLHRKDVSGGSTSEESPKKRSRKLFHKVLLNLEELKITNMQEHYQRLFKDLDKEFRTNKKGRKRVNILQSVNMYEYIYIRVVPEWEKMLTNCSSRERELGILQKKKAYAWPQFLKDVQKFYRIVFKHRFHRLDKRNNDNRESLAKRLLYELGIDYAGDFSRAFEYFYPVLMKLRKEIPQKHSDEKAANLTDFASIDELLEDNLATKLVAFFMVNFAENYIDKLKAEFKKNIQSILQEFLAHFDTSVSSLNFKLSSE